MKKNLHPKYRAVVFQDNGAGFAFLTRSTIATKDTVTWEDGKTYPLVKVDISSASHPFFTGKQMFVDTAGRVERFSKKFGGTYSFQKTAAPAAPVKK
jgi:large subunit ribosomal protein L31